MADRFTKEIIEALEHYRKNRSCQDVEKVKAVCNLHDEIFKPAVKTNQSCSSCKGKAFARLMQYYDKQQIQTEVKRVPTPTTRGKKRGRPRKKK